MTRREGAKLIIEQTEPTTCFYCHKVAELRPYGPQGQSICFDCGMHNPEETERQFLKLLEGCNGFSDPTVRE